MALPELLSPEFSRELKTLRTTLERVPDDQPEFRPHERSMALAKLAGHTAQVPAYVSLILGGSEFDYGEGRVEPLMMRDREQLLAAFDAIAAKAEADLAATSDEELAGTWRLLYKGQVAFSGTRYQALRTVAFNHLIHHRAQLGVYLRLLGQPVPSVYGPTADEQ